MCPQPQFPQDLGFLPGDFQVVEDRIVHHVPHVGNCYRPINDPFLPQVHYRIFRGTKEEVGYMVDDHSIDLLGHGSIITPQASFHVGNGIMELTGRQRAGQGTVGIAIDNDDIGSLAQEDFLYPLQHPSRLFTVACRPNAKMVPRFP